MDSTPMRLCLPIRVKRFKTMREAMGKAVSSTKITLGFKVHIVTDERGKKVINFC
ncbi:MAG: hypothetical protein LBG86_00070, partial [Puniceicoccales bacterium]|nr:hypothetical protein [Puniceicoccales bacterium]